MPTNFTGRIIERIYAAHRANYMDVICNQLTDDKQKVFEQEHIREISDVLGSDGLWFNTEVLIAVGEK